MTWPKGSGASLSGSSGRSSAPYKPTWGHLRPMPGSNIGRR
jgi:hypothetical protein